MELNHRQNTISAQDKQLQELRNKIEQMSLNQNELLSLRKEKADLTAALQIMQVKNDKILMQQQKLEQEYAQLDDLYSRYKHNLLQDDSK